MCISIWCVYVYICSYCSEPLLDCKFSEDVSKDYSANTHDNKINCLVDISLPASKKKNVEPLKNALHELASITKYWYQSLLQWFTQPIAPHTSPLIHVSCLHSPQILIGRRCPELSPPASPTSDSGLLGRQSPTGEGPHVGRFGGDSPLASGTKDPQLPPYQMFVFRLWRGQIALVPWMTFRALPPFYYVSKHVIAGKPVLMTGRRILLASPYRPSLFALLLKPARSQAVFFSSSWNLKNWGEEKKLIVGKQRGLSEEC